MSFYKKFINYYKIRGKYFYILIVLILFLNFCGYRLRGTGSFLPAHIKTIHIPEFVNSTSRIEISRIVTNEIISAFISRGNLKLVDDEEKADALLKGEIKVFSVVPSGVQQGQASSYKVRVRVKVEMFDLRYGKILYNNPSYLYIDEYATSGEADFMSIETSSIQEIAEELAESLINNILEGF